MNILLLLIMYASSLAMEKFVTITISGGTDDLYRTFTLHKAIGGPFKLLFYVHVHRCSSLTSNVFNSNSTEFPCSVSNGDQDLDQWAARPCGNGVAVPLPVVKEKLAID